MIPTVFELHDVLFDDTACNRYLLDQDVYYRALPCPGCGANMERNADKMVFRCPRKSCHRRELSLRKHTFFYGSMLKSNKILFLAHLWLNRVSNSSARSITGFSQHTVTSFYAHFRRLVASALDEEQQVIGGAEIIVEVDETKLGRRKYNRGHRVDGVWVVVGVERTEARKVFLVAVEDRSAATLTEIIRRHVHPGSVVHTDLWRGYSSVAEETGLRHRTVNHSAGFIDEETGVHTNTVEGTNHALKIQVPIRCRTRNGIDDHLLEFMWRRQHADTLWDSFISAIREIHYDL